ncbi:MAG: ATP-binding protein [Candidatus Omnitrophica bacterium]|nr:ATP-binding protein [Candidatus Omnitrophota bacterium]
MKKSSYGKNLFGLHLSQELEDFLRDTNPWWSGKPMRRLPEFRRWLFDHTLQRLKTGLAPVIVLRGPRQVGKTTLQEQIILHLLSQENVDPKNIFRVQFDEIPSLKGLKDPILSICRWYQERILGETFNESINKNRPVYIFFDEVQNLTDWSPQIKSLVDLHSVRILLTGSSALRIEQGRDSLAGRITTLELGTLLLREIAELQNFEKIVPMIVLNGLKELTQKDFWADVRTNGEKYKEVRDKAFNLFSERGGYPVAQVRIDRPWGEVSDQLNETVIKRVIQHDLRIGERGRKRDQDLLEELFRLCCRYIGQAPAQAMFITELRKPLSANVGWNRVLAYLRFLNNTLLIRLIDPLEIRIKKRKGRPKICLCDHALRASWLQELIPFSPQGLASAPHLSDLAGHIAESVLGYFLAGIPNLDVAWFPERADEPEVDYVVSVGEFRIPIEVKYRRHIDSHRDTIGLRSFIEKTVYNAPFGILVTLNDDTIIDDPRIVTVPLSSFLLLR